MRSSVFNAGAHDDNVNIIPVRVLGTRVKSSLYSQEKVFRSQSLNSPYMKIMMALV